MTIILGTGMRYETTFDRACLPNVPSQQEVHHDKGRRIPRTTQCMRLWFVLLCAFYIADFSPAARADLLPAVHFTDPVVNYQNDFAWSIGFDFYVWEDISVSAFGFYDADADGFNEDHAVGLWNEYGELLAQAVVTNDSALTGLFRWESVRPTNLHA